MKRMFIMLFIATAFLCCLSGAFASTTSFDKYGGWEGLKGEKKGCFHTQQINGRWWIITPEGNVFFLKGMYCVRFGGLPESGTEKRAYKEACIRKYGNEIKWSEAARSRLEKWGFNTIGDWSSESAYKGTKFVYITGIDLPLKAENVIPKGSYGYFPDVFSQEFINSAKEAMESKFNAQPYLIDDPWLLGYFLADEPSWYGSKGRRGSLTDDFISLDATKPGKVAWTNFVKNKYSSIEELNNKWETSYQNFNELLTVNKVKDAPGPTEDKLDFLRVVAEKFAMVLHDELRKIDKNHMILGTRPTRIYPEVVEGTGKYTDIFSMGWGDLYQGYSINPDFSRIINQVHGYAKKPIILGIMISAQDAGLPYGALRTQKDRGISYWRYLAEAAAHPAIVGLQWFQYFDPPKKCYDKQASNWGLVNEQDEPYEEAVKLISQANNTAYAYALGLASFAPEFDGFFSVEKKDAIESAKDLVNRIIVPIPNSDFEKGEENWKFQTWKGKSRTSLDAFVKHGGRIALKIEGGADEKWGSVGVAVQYGSSFVLKPGFRYKLSAWIKTKDVESSAFMRIKIKYKSGDTADFNTESVFGTSDWKLSEIGFTPREENTVEYLAAELVGRGVAWFDDILLEVIKG